MSIKFEGGQTSSLRDEFRERKEYKEYEGFERFDIIDTHYESFKYGMMNRQYEPITLISDQVDETLENFPEPSDEVRVLPFVAQAFNDFKEHYKAFVESAVNPVINYPKFINAVRPLKGYVNFAEEFAKYLNYNLGVIKRSFANDKTIKDFDTFIERFFETFEEVGREYPITKSGFITSEYCSIMTTGLCIEFNEKDYDIDFPKGEMILSSDYECFAEHANLYGFLIDKYVPWRLVADINSPKMREYMVKGRAIPVERAVDFFENTFTTKSCYDDLYLMRNYLFSIYYPLYRNNTGDMSPIPPLPISKIVDILFRVRVIELGLRYENYTEVRQKVVDIYNQYGLRYVQGYIGQITSDRLREIYGPK